MTTEPNRTEPNRTEPKLYKKIQLVTIKLTN